MTAPTLDDLRVDVRGHEVIVVAVAGVWAEYRGSREPRIADSIGDALVEQVHAYEHARAELRMAEQRQHGGEASGR